MIYDKNSNHLPYANNYSFDNIGWPQEGHHNSQHRHRNRRHKNSAIPRLDLISQHSSIEIPWTKGAIDIDFRSTTDSSIFDSIDDSELENIDRDSLDEHICKTILPKVSHNDLLINHGEYDSYRNQQGTPKALRRLSDISIPSQYRPELPQQTQKAPHAIISKREAADAAESSLESPAVKPTVKPHGLNFVELNKAVLNHQQQHRQPRQSRSYADLFSALHSKDSSKKTPNDVSQTLKRDMDSPKRPPHVDAPQTFLYDDQSDPAAAVLSAAQYWSRRDRSLERLSTERLRDAPIERREASADAPITLRSPRHVFTDAPYRRQPTLYDERLLERKTKVAPAVMSILPPLLAARDSSGEGYSASQRRKAAAHEQFSLRLTSGVKVAAEARRERQCSRSVRERGQREASKDGKEQESGGSKASLPSSDHRPREQPVKRDLMLSYSRAVKEKQARRQSSRAPPPEAAPPRSEENASISRELLGNVDLERLLLRHENDKRITDQIRLKWEKKQ